MDKQAQLDKLRELILDTATDRNDFYYRRIPAPMKKRTYRETCVDYIKKTMRCVGYRDYVVAELEKLGKIEQIVNSYVTDNPKEPMYDTEDYMNSIKEILEGE